MQHHHVLVRPFCRSTLQQRADPIGLGTIVPLSFLDHHLHFPDCRCWVQAPMWSMLTLPLTKSSDGLFRCHVLQGKVIIRIITVRCVLVFSVLSCNRNPSVLQRSTAVDPLQSRQCTLSCHAAIMPTPRFRRLLVGLLEDRRVFACPGRFLARSFPVLS